MKNTPAIALLIAATFIAAGLAHAQDHSVKANVPFNFTVGDRTLPSGTYLIGSNMNTPDLLAIRNQGKNVNILALGLPDGKPGHDNTLVFHKYGEHYFLYEIRSGAAMNTYFPVSKAEKRARTEVEEAGLFVNDPVLIALK